MSLGLLIGTIKAEGLLSPKVQKILQHHCGTGHIVEVADVVARVLYDQALQEHSIPEPVGVRTRELVERAQDGIRNVVEAYARRGVLCAKGYYPPSQLALLLLDCWESDFNGALRHVEIGSGLPDTTDHDFVARAAVAAQALAKMLEKLPRSQEGDALLPMKDMEGFCIAAVRMMHAAYTKPDVTVHELVHGHTPEET